MYEKETTNHITHLFIESSWTDVIQKAPFAVKTVKPQFNKSNPKAGIGILEWSTDGKYLFSRNDNMPQCLWIWEISRLSLSAMLCQMDAVKQAQWDPTRNRVALCCKNSRIYMWHPEGASCVEVPIST